MSRRRVLAIALTAATVAVDILIIVQGIASGPTGAGSQVGPIVASFVFMVAFLGAGTLIATRRPENRMGWLFLWMALAFGVAVLVSNYSEAASPRHLSPFVAWVDNWIWNVTLAPIGLLFLWFPDGRAPGRVWRRAGLVLVAAAGVFILAEMLIPGPLSGAGLPIDNPYGIRALQAVSRIVAVTSAVVLVGAEVACMASSVSRFRGARGELRLQLKWVAYAAGLVIVLGSGGLLAEVLLGSSPTMQNAVNSVVSGSLALLPISAGIAILRHRLYDIDRIINRTLVYAVLTAVLVGTYAGLVLGLEALVGSGNAVVVAGSTLVVAALFDPLRRRLQSGIDRRFYRRKYDAEQTLAAFGARLRDQVDLDELRRHLVGTVVGTVQPSAVSLWLRDLERVR